MRHLGWAIIGDHGFYTGWWLTRRAAIDFHCEALCQTWEYCRKKGDRAVKIKIETL